MLCITLFDRGFYSLFGKKMRNPNEMSYSLTILKAGAYEEAVNFNEWDTIRDVFSRAGVDYEEGTLEGVAYTPDSELEASDNNARIEVSTKQIKQG